MTALALILCLLPGLAASLELFHRDTLNVRGPSSLEFDPTLCGVWIANEEREVAFMGPTGEIIRRFYTALFTVKSLTLTPQGVLISDGTGRFELRSREGEQLVEPYRLPGAIWDIEGIIAREGGGLVITQDDDARVWEIDSEGNELWAIAGFQMSPPMVEPQGIAYDRRTGALYVVDDQEGWNSLFEFAPDGTLLAQVSLREWGRDPEGIAIQADTGTMWIGFDDGGALATFDYLPTLRDEAPDATPDACALF